MYILKLILVPNFSSLGWFSFSSTVISCHPLLTAVDSWKQLIWKKIYLNFMYTLKLILVQNFSSLNCYQLLTVDDSWYEKSSPGIIMYTLKLILVPNFSSLAWFSFSPVVNSCHELLTAVDSWWQMTWKKIDWNFYVHTKVDTCAKVQLSM